MAKQAGGATRWRRGHVHAWERSGLSRSRYAKDHGLHPTTFQGWCRKFLATQEFFSGAVDTPSVELVAVPQTVLGGSCQLSGGEPRIDIHFRETFRIAVSPGFSPELLGKVIQTLGKL